MTEPAESRRDIAAALSRYGPVIGVAASVSWSLYTLGEHGLEPLASLVDSVLGTTFTIGAPLILAIVGARWWYQRSAKGGPQVANAQTVASGSVRVDTQAAAPTNVDDTKFCPICAEAVRANAAVCRYCGHVFVPKQAAGTLRTPASLAVLLVGLVVVGGGAVFLLRDRSLSDGELIWCRSHPGDVAAAADALRLDPPSPTYSWSDWAVLSQPDSVLNGWDTLEASANGRRDQACRAAFSGKR